MNPILKNILGLLLASGASAVHADTFHWNETGSASWSQNWRYLSGGQWVLGSPTPYDDATMQNGGQAVILGATIGAAQTLFISDDSGVWVNGGSLSTYAARLNSAPPSSGNPWGGVLVDGETSVWNNATDISINNGLLVVQGGGTVNTDTLLVAKGVVSNGNVIVTGEGSSLNAASSISLGGQYKASLTVADGATVSVNNGGGTLETTGFFGGDINIGTGGRAGIIHASEIALGGDSHLTFNHTDTDYAFAQDITGGSGDIHFIGSGKTVFTNRSAVAGNINIDAGIVELVNSSMTQSGGWRSLTVDGILRVSDASHLSSGDSFVDNGGEVTVSGEGTRWDSGSGSFVVGGNGNGSVEILDGAEVTHNGGSNNSLGVSEGSLGTVRVSGEGSHWTAGDLTVGKYGEGDLRVESGATIEGHFLIASELGGAGSITVTGEGSQLTSSQISLGFKGNGVLSISDGGVVSTRNMILSETNDGTGSIFVIGEGSRLEVTSGNSDLGGSGSSSTTISGGGSATFRNVYLGGQNGAVSTVTVEGAGSSIVSTGDEFDIGARNGRGIVTVRDGATVEVQKLRIGRGYGGELLVEGSGSEWVSLNGTDVVGSADGESIPLGAEMVRITVRDGGKISNFGNEWTMGYGSKASTLMEIIGEGSRFESAKRIAISGANENTIKIMEGGAATGAQGVYVGAWDGGAGHLWVDGAGSTLDITGQLEIDRASVTASNEGNIATDSLKLRGDQPTRLSITGGASVTVSGSMELTSSIPGSSIVRVEGSGSLLDVGETLEIVKSRAVVSDGGALHVGNRIEFRSGEGSELIIGGETVASHAGILDTREVFADWSNTIIFNHNDDYTFENLDGDGILLSYKLELKHRGAGQTTLTVASDYRNGTSIEAGTLVAAASNALGSGDVVIHDTATLVIRSGVEIQNRITLEGGTLRRELAGGSELSGKLDVTADLVGGHSTNAQLIDGVASNAGAFAATFSLASTAANDSRRSSDILSLDGLDGTMFVLQLSAEEVVSADSYLVWLNPETNLWVNAVEGNSTGFSYFAGDVEYNSALHFQLGYYGYDSAKGTVWAVIDHNSDFAAVPEPSVLGLVGTAGIWLIWRRRRSS